MSRRSNRRVHIWDYVKPRASRVFLWETEDTLNFRGTILTRGWRIGNALYSRRSRKIAVLLSWDNGSASTEL